MLFYQSRHISFSSGLSAIYGSLVLWTALSLALGVEVQGEIVRGLPCIKRLNQLFCRNAGTSYPSDNIEGFIDENKALTRRMYGDFQSDLGFGEVVESAIRIFRRGKRSAMESPPLINLHVPPPPPTSPLNPVVTNHVTNNLEDLLRANGDLDSDLEALWYLVEGSANRTTSGVPGGLEWESTDDFQGSNRTKRQVGASGRRPSVVPPPPTRTSNSDRKDSCDSKMEIVTPYWASNSAGKILAIVNVNEFSQVIHQEVCTRSSTKRCHGDCGCEQKYKWHRMLAYDLENECKGVFIDWFLFPSNCACRCDP